MANSIEKQLFSNRLINLCDEKGLAERGRQTVLKKICGVTQQSVSKWFHAEAIPEYEQCLKLCNYFNVNFEWLLRGTGIKRNEISAATPSSGDDFVVNVTAAQHHATRNRVPIISAVQAGEFSFTGDQFPPGYAEEYIETSVPVKSRTFALKVKGDSMEPEFTEGMILIVEPEMDFSPNDFVIVKNGDEATFKQLIKDGLDWYLKPLNPRYPIKPLGSSKIIGVVREATRRLK